jgi:ABC-2 type transport system ATP-binding protein
VTGLKQDGTTVLLTTHYLDEAEALADRVAVIAGGRIVEVNTPAALGGRNAGQATVRWRAPGGLRTVATDAPTALVAQLAAELGGEIPELTVTRPTLEDVYLQMIGETTTRETDGEAA